MYITWSVVWLSVWPICVRSQIKRSIKEIEIRKICHNFYFKAKSFECFYDTFSEPTKSSVPTKPDKSYIGLSEDEWKKRYYNHRKSFRNQHYQWETILSSYVWETKRTTDKIPSLKWSIITALPAYSNIAKHCQLCLNQKYAIITYPDPENLLNKRSEIMSKCPHQRKFLLSNYDTRD